MANSYLTSDTLIDSVKRRHSIPISQNTFEEADLLAFANEEMDMGLVPLILQYHEEYFVASMTVPITAYKSNYPIPSRAIGGRLRDMMFQDQQGNIREMVRILPDDRAYYQSTGGDSFFHKFYLQNNEVILLPTVGPTPTGNLIMTYFLRPNELVAEDRAALVTSINTTSGTSVLSITNGAATIFTFTAAHGLTTGDSALIIGTTYSNLNTTHVVTVTSPTTFTVPVDTTLAGAITGGTWVVSAIISLASIPDNFTVSSLVDFVETQGHHNTTGMDIAITAVDTAGMTVTIDITDVSSDLTVGDYINTAGEAIIPQIPDELHPLLAQRVAARCLEAMGDVQNLNSANTKLAEMELRSGSVIDNRVEGSPQKVVNRHGLLRTGKIGIRRRSVW